MPQPADSDPRMPSASPSVSAEPGHAGFLRRLGAVTVDWLLAQLVVGLLGVDAVGGGAAAAFAPLAVFALSTVLLVATVGSSIGHRVFGLQVWQVRPGSFTLQVVVRTLLLCLFVPALLTAQDGRGLHDVAAGTRIVRP